ncbi:hypothetical protein [Flavicella sp.]|uniref:hypothetical protein n=1 Tax=Flavicella sp. TaxID=2957742 RepID=UPI0026316D5B|nr:hypothetical protein [Flavicella sp.]MDG1805945.1 hypothetical protein [Flavicella sp.]
MVFHKKNGGEKKQGRKKEMNDEKKELDNLAVRTFSWLTGTSTDNDYVSVGKVAHYFGVISLRLDSGHTLSRGGLGKKAFQILNLNQQKEMLALLEELKAPLKEYHTYHNLLNRELEKLLRREELDRDKCILFSEKQLMAEGKIGLISAQKFYKIYITLSSSQLHQLKEMRKQITQKKFVEVEMTKEEKRNSNKIHMKIL